ncbi:hypothetical protein [Actinomadura spongiicola]|nr:hypothetical protein [Actinomadura spongiicola]
MRRAATACDLLAVRIRPGAHLAAEVLDTLTPLRDDALVTGVELA